LRMEIMTSTSDGFELSERDLEMRGPGDFFGVRQSGLPQFKVADLTEDYRMLEYARKEEISVFEQMGGDERRVIRRVDGVLLIAAAVVLFFWQDIQEHFTDRVNDRVIEAFQNGDEEVEVNSVESFITGIEPDTSADTGVGEEDNLETRGINISDDMAGILN